VVALKLRGHAQYYYIRGKCSALYGFEPIERVENFTDSPRGMEKLDSICMR